MTEGEDSWPAVAFEKLRNAAIGVGLSGFGIEPHGLDSLSQLKLNFVRLSPEIYSIYKKTPLLLRSIALLCRVDLIAPDVTSPVTGSEPFNRGNSTLCPAPKNWSGLDLPSL